MRCVNNVNIQLLLVASVACIEVSCTRADTPENSIGYKTRKCIFLYYFLFLIIGKYRKHTNNIT